MNPSVSVIIPTYNRADIILETIESVFNQTYQNFEIVIVDDGSSDNTKEVIENLKNPRIKYIYQKNSGPSAARNNGIKNAKGELIAFLDSDDLWLKDKLEKQINILNYRPEIGIISCWAVGITFDNRILYKRTGSAKNNKEFIRGVLFNPDSVISGTPAIIIKRECFDKVGFFDEEMKCLEDWDMWFRIALEYEFFCVNEILTYFRSHQSLSKTINIREFNDSYMMFLNKIISNQTFLKKFPMNINKIYSYNLYRIGWLALCLHRNKEIAKENIIKSVKKSFFILLNPQVSLAFLLCYLPIFFTDSYCFLRKGIKQILAKLYFILNKLIKDLT